MRTSRRTSLARAAGLAALAIAAACASRDATAPSPLALTGTWNQGANLRDTANGQTHIHVGHFSLAQRGETFTGTGQQTGYCHAASGNYTGPLADGTLFHVTDGVQQGTHVAFKTELCSYEGTLTADGAHIDGTARCAYTDGGTPFVWTGDWLADRER
jgi:hypothetical protein